MMITRKILAAGGALLGALVLLSGVALVGGGLGWNPGAEDTAAQTEQDSDQRAVSVTGSGQVSVRPDTGLVTAGVEVRNENLDTALDEANQQIEAIRSAVMELGVAEEDIQTANFSIWPEYSQEEGQARELVGYNVNHTLNIKVHEIEQTGTVVSAAVDAGANVVNNVAFIVDDPGAAVSQAREQAVADARAKAEELASLADASLGPVVSINETSSTPPRPVPGAEASDDSAARPDVDFAPGQSTVSVNVNVSWELQ